MRGRLAAAALAALLLMGAAAAPEPSEHELIYFNARLALREGRPLEAIKLWLLRNALEDQTHTVSIHDGDFASVTWVALGELGLCQDGHVKDKAGAGLWPLAMHNWVVRNMGRRPRAGRRRPFDAFDVNRQQRFVAIGDVLGSAELDSVSLYRGRCFGWRLPLVAAGELPNAKLSDRQVAARLLRHLLIQSRYTLESELVRGRSVIEARLFDIHLKLAELAAAEARRESRSEALLGRRIGLSRESVAELREDAPTTTLDPDSEAAHILMDSATWSVAEWMALTPDRRLFLFDAAQGFGVDAVLLDRVAIGILDELIAAGEGEQVEQWIPRVDKGVADPRVWSGRRGQQLLDLDLESGFQERSVIALHRGVAQLERGELDPALQLLAYAMNHGPESKDAEAVQTLSLRWLSYVASGFEITEELLTTLEALVPRREYVILLEDMMWRAAFRADARSFDVGLAHLEGRGALERRLEVLDPLARGDVGAFLRLIRGGLAESPSETLRLLDQLLERLEREDAEVRAAQLPTLRQARELLQDIPGAEEAGKAQARKVEDLLARSQAIIEGLEGLGMDASVKDRARALAPGSEVFAGALRLAPVDPLPWPFRAAQSSAPSIFTPMELVPVEWRDADGEWVFGWAIRG